MRDGRRKREPFHRNRYRDIFVFIAEFLLCLSVSLSPFLLPLLVSLTPDNNFNRDQVLRHLFFVNADSRLPPSCVLRRLVAVYTQRSYDLWGGDAEAMQFLFDGAWEVLVEVDQGSWGYKEEEQELSTHYGEGSPLDKYRQVDSADFRAEFARLPPELNPLDPALADPAVARRGRLRLRRGMLGGRAGMQPQQQMWGEADEGRTRGLLDVNLPLAELFWRSLLPWNSIDSSRRHRR